MNHKHLEQAIEQKQNRLEELKQLESGKHSAEEIRLLEDEIARDLAQLEEAAVVAELDQKTRSSSLSQVVKDAIKEELHVEEEINALGDEAEGLEREALIEEYRKLFAEVSLEGFSDDDKVAIKKRAEFFESGRDDALEMKYDADSILQRLYGHPGNVELKKRILVDFGDDIMPYSMQKGINSIVREDATFLESTEFQKVKERLVLVGLEKRDMVVKKEKDSTGLFEGDEDDIVDIWEIRSDTSLLKELPENIRGRARSIFLEGLSSDTFEYAEVVPSRVFDAAQAMNISDEDLQRAVFEGFSGLLKKGKVPKGAYRESFVQASKLLSDAMASPETSSEIMKSVLDRSRKGRINSQAWESFGRFMNATSEDRVAYLESLADCSEKDMHDMERSLFRELSSESSQYERSALSPEEKKFVFDRVPSQARTDFLARKMDHAFILEAYKHLPFTTEELLEGVLKRFSARGVRTEMNERELAHVLENLSQVFGVEENQEQVLQKIYKRQLFEKNSSYDKSPESILHHVTQKGISFSPEELKEHKDEIRKLYLDIFSTGSAGEFKGAERLADVFGPAEQYVSALERYEIIRSFFVNPPEDGKQNKTFSDLKHMSEFIPREYKMRLLTDPEWQNRIGSMYEDYLSAPSRAWQHAGVKEGVGFFISRAETYEEAEARALQVVVEADPQGKDLDALLTLFLKILATHPESKTLLDVKELVQANLEQYLENFEDYPTLRRFGPHIPGLEAAVQKRAHEELSKLTPEASFSDQKIRGLFVVRYGGAESDYDSYGLKYEMFTRFFRGQKSFEFFEHLDASYPLGVGRGWDATLEKALLMPDEEAESYVALLSFLTENHDVSWASAADAARQAGLESFAVLFEKIQGNVQVVQELNVRASDLQDQFGRLIGMTLEKQREIIFVGALSERIGWGKIADVPQIMEALGLPRESVSEAVFQSASRWLVTKNFGRLNTLWETFPELKEKFGAESPRDIILNSAMSELEEGSVVNKDIKSARMRNLKEAFWVSERFDKLPASVQEKVQVFQSEHGDKGKRLAALAIAAYGLENEGALLDKLSRIEAVLALHRPENIPQGVGVSCGIEYEVGPSIGKIYNQESALGYEADIEMLNELTGMKSGGAGGLAIHEIATSPTTNPYLLIAEVKLLQDAGMLDFNFKKYPDASRGYHLSLGGERSLYADTTNMRFLYNMVTMTGNAGLLVGKEVRSVKSIHSKPLDSMGGFNKGGERVEFKGMGGDTFEQFERTVLFAHHAGIASQLQDKLIGMRSEEFTRGIPDTLEDFSVELELEVKEGVTDKEKRIVFEWMQLKKQMILAVEQHNESFIEAEFFGSLTTPEGEYRELGLEQNYAAKRRRYFGKEDIPLADVQKGYKIPSGMFQPLHPGFVNALTRSNNLLIFKEPVLSEDKLDAKGRVVQNSNAYAFQTEMNGEGYRKGLEGTPYSSIFDRDGNMRDGYYPIQGTSEEMITHKSQILLNRFNKNMEDLLRE